MGHHHLPCLLLYSQFKALQTGHPVDKDYSPLGTCCSWSCGRYFYLREDPKLVKDYPCCQHWLYNGLLTHRIHLFFIRSFLLTGRMKEMPAEPLGPWLPLQMQCRARCSSGFPYKYWCPQRGAAVGDNLMIRQATWCPGSKFLTSCKHP